jgi:hypothetical protein
MWMKFRGMIAVILLCAASLFAQTAAPAPAMKMDDHAACSRKEAKAECCKKNKDVQATEAKTEAKKDCCKKGKCARNHEKDKKDAAPVKG